MQISKSGAGSYPAAIPVIDIGRLHSGEEHAFAAVGSEIGRACREMGFFYISRHGISQAVTDRLIAASQQFFCASPDWKQQYSIERSRHNRGYVALAGEALNPEQGSDLKEAFNIGLELAPDDRDLAAGLPFRGLNLWPDLPGWRETMLGYFDAMREINRLLHHAIAHDLGLAPDFFDDKFDKPISTLRLLRYPPQPASRQRAGAGVHTDYGNLTILMQHRIGGLQVQSVAGEWIDAPLLPGCFVCNIGDCLMRWTNDVYQSTPHRVVNASDEERYSVVFFSDPNPEADITCLPGCVSATHPARYGPITSADYLTERLNATYAFRRPLK